MSDGIFPHVLPGVKDRIKEQIKNMEASDLMILSSSRMLVSRIRVHSDPVGSYKEHQEKFRDQINGQVYELGYIVGYGCSYYLVVFASDADMVAWRLTYN